MKRTLTHEEAAKYLGVSATSLDALVHTGELPGAKISQRWIFREDDLEEYLQEQVRIQTQMRREARFAGKSAKINTAVTDVRKGRRRGLPVLPELPITS